MASKISQLRALDAEIVNHIIARGKLWEKRKNIVRSLAGSDELFCYQAELKEWLQEVNNDEKESNKP